MATAKQLGLFDEFSENHTELPVSTQLYSGRELGTFKDSMRAPIHRWFRYPAGYSYKFVSESFDLFHAFPGTWVYDPFSGTGTTLLCAKQQGIHAYGVEAHSFVHWVASVKLYWEYDLNWLEWAINDWFVKLRKTIPLRSPDVNLEGVFPALVYKCFHPDDLKVLYLLREFVLTEIDNPAASNLLQLALTDTLRGAALAGTGWPYISPRKNNGEKPPKNALSVFETTVKQMFFDLNSLGRTRIPCETHNILGDSRQPQTLADGQIKLALTSPPYLNNYDYADRTRLETYFWAIARSWEDISRQFRDRLIVAATTQINRSRYHIETALSDEIKLLNPEVFRVIQTAVLELAKLRMHKGGKKDYDLMVALYFNDMLPVLKETYRVLEAGGHFCLVLGDSAPYGVHIPTDQLIGQLGLSLGFSSFDYYPLRKRGDKWKHNPQRHNVPLREGVVILKK